MSGRIENRLRELQALPELQPPAHLERRTLDAMQAASARSRLTLARAASWIVLIGTVGLLAVFATGFEERDARDAPEASGPPGDEALLQQLAAESVALERILATLPQRRVMRVSTAGTIAGLEDQILLIDAELFRAGLESEPTAYRARLWRERNDVMSALVNVRYAQSIAFEY